MIQNKGPEAAGKSAEMETFTDKYKSLDVIGHLQHELGEIQP